MILETIEPNNENIGSNTKNLIKGRIKQIKNILLQSKEMNNTESNTVKNLLESINELYDVSHRRNMEDYIYMFSRRQKAIKALALLDSVKNKLTDDEYKESKDLVKNIFLENRSKQILPNKHWIIKSWKLKTELYLNMNNEVNHNVLEPREYIGINPEVWFDSDAPSIVTAMTPPKYEQPIHNHANNREITFYTWPSIWKFYDKWDEHIIEADFWDFIIFPPKTYHTIKNPNDFPVRNISIKLPWALFDRWRILENSEPWKWEKQSLEFVEKWIYFKEFPLQNVPYKIYIYDFSEIESIQVTPTGKSALYVLNWDFICNIDWEKKSAISEADVIIANSTNKIDIDVLNTWIGKIYMVTLQDNIEE